MFPPSLRNTYRVFHQLSDLGWVDLHLGWFTQLLRRFCRKLICPSKIGQVAEHPWSKSTQHPTNVRVRELMEHPCHCHKSADFFPFLHFLGTPLPPPTADVIYGSPLMTNDIFPVAVAEGSHSARGLHLEARRQPLKTVSLQ